MTRGRNGAQEQSFSAPGQEHPRAHPRRRPRQQGLRVGLGDRRGRAAGPRPRRHRRPDELGQGPRAVRLQPLGRRRPRAHVGEVLHALRPLHPARLQGRPRVPLARGRGRRRRGDRARARRGVHPEEGILPDGRRPHRLRRRRHHARRLREGADALALRGHALRARALLRVRGRLPREAPRRSRATSRSRTRCARSSSSSSTPSPVSAFEGKTKASYEAEKDPSILDRAIREELLTAAYGARPATA